MTLSPSQVARKLGCSPVDVSQVFYRRLIPDSAAPIVGRSRQIPEALIPQVAEKLRQIGKLPQQTAV